MFRSILERKPVKYTIRAVVWAGLALVGVWLWHLYVVLIWGVLG